jgi:putative colanic acid biosynthesis glycosyltransferase
MTKETSPLLSIIIPSYNQLEGLKETLKAFTKFRNKRVELIVIDGQSSDDSPNWIRENEASMDCHQIESDKGIYDAMNKGVALSKGQWVVFFGTGDLPTEDGFAELIRILEEEEKEEGPDTEVLAFGVHLLPPRESGVPEFYQPVWNASLKWRNTLHHQGAIYSRTVLRNEPYDLRFKVLADYHLNLKLWNQGARCMCFDTVISEVAPGGVSRKFTQSLYLEERALKRNIFPSIQDQIAQHVFTRLKWLKKQLS